MLEVIKSNLHMIINQLDKEIDQQHQDLKFYVGDQVLLRIHLEIYKYVQDNLKNMNIILSYKGSFTLLSTMYLFLHLIFHISQLKRYNVHN